LPSKFNIYAIVLEVFYYPMGIGNHCNMKHMFLDCYDYCVNTGIKHEFQIATASFKDTTSIILKDVSLTKEKFFFFK